MNRQVRVVDIAVVGGGMAGLSCAHEVARRGATTLVLEGSDRLGGRVRTTHVGEATTELGASFVAGFYSETRRLISDLALDSRVDSDSQETWVSAGHGRTGVVWPAKKLYRSSVVSLAGRLMAVRGILSLIAEARRVSSLTAEAVVELDDASVASWVEDRFGSEFADVVINPLLRSLFFWEPSHTSRALLPLILKGLSVDSHFYRVSGGMEAIVAGIGSRVEHELRAPVERVTARNGRFEVDSPSGRVLAKSVVLACPAVRAVEVLDSGGLFVPSALRKVQYSNIRVGVIAFDTDRAWPLPTRRSLVFTPLSSDKLVAIKPVFSSPERGVAGMRFYWSGEVGELMGDKAIGPIRHELTSTGQMELASLLDHGARISETIDWSCALPLFDVGYVRSLVDGDLVRGLSPGVFLAGDYTVAPHLEGAVNSGTRAARLALSHVARL